MTVPPPPDPLITARPVRDGSPAWGGGSAEPSSSTTLTSVSVHGVGPDAYDEQICVAGRSVTVRAAGIVLRRFTANDAVLAATHASFAGEGPATASLVILHGRGRTLSIVGPGGALARVPLPAPAARLWALGPDAGLLCGGVGGGGMTLAHPLDAPEPVAGWGPGAAVAWVGARDGLALTTAAAAAGGGEAEVALWSLKLSGRSVDGVGGGGPAPPASPLTAGAPGTPGSSAPRR